MHMHQAKQIKKVKQEALNISCILKQSVFSQLMMENLINDLLDLAKLEVDQFKFFNKYFNLSQTIFESL